MQVLLQIVPIFDPSHPCLPVNPTALHLLMSVQCTVHTEVFRMYTLHCTVFTRENSTVVYSSLQQPVIFLSSPLVTRNKPGLGWRNHTHTHTNPHSYPHTQTFKYTSVSPRVKQGYSFLSFFFPFFLFFLLLSFHLLPRVSPMSLSC